MVVPRPNIAQEAKNAPFQPKKLDLIRVSRIVCH